MLKCLGPNTHCVKILRYCPFCLPRTVLYCTQLAIYVENSSLMLILISKSGLSVCYLFVCLYTRYSVWNTAGGNGTSKIWLDSVTLLYCLI